MPCRSPAPGPVSHPTFSAWMSRSASPRREQPRNQAAPTRLTFAGQAGSRKQRATARAEPLFRSARSVKIRIGYEITYDCPKPTPMLLVLSVHPSRQADLLTPNRITFDRPIAAADYRDGFDNICSRIVAPMGVLTVSSEQIIADAG